MSWDMIMKLPIQDRRALIHKHNKEQEEISKEYSNSRSSNEIKHEGELINRYAKLEQENIKNMNKIT